MSTYDKQPPRSDENWRSAPTTSLPDVEPTGLDATQAISFSEENQEYELSPEKDWIVKRINVVSRNGLYEQLNFMIASQDYGEDIGFPVKDIEGMPFRVEAHFEPGDSPNNVKGKLIVRSIQRQVVVKKAGADLTLNLNETQEVRPNDIIDLGKDFKCSFSLEQNSDQPSVWNLTMKPYQKHNK